MPESRCGKRVSTRGKRRRGLRMRICRLADPHLDLWQCLVAAVLILKRGGRGARGGLNWWLRVLRELRVYGLGLGEGNTSPVNGQMRPACGAHIRAVGRGLGFGGRCSVLLLIRILSRPRVSRGIQRLRRSAALRNTCFGSEGDALSSPPSRGGPERPFNPFTADGPSAGNEIRIRIRHDRRPP